MRKTVVLCLVLGLIMMAFIGCGSTQETPSKDDEGSAPADATQKTASDEEEADVVDDSGVNITVWTNFEVEAELLQKYADLWSEQTGNTAQVILNSIEIQEFAQATNSPNGPDGIYGIANDQLANFATAGLAQEVPADLYNESDYADAAVQACYAGGVRYGVPIAVETTALFYNTDKVSQAPKTWDEMLAVAKESGGIKFDATSIYYNLGFVRAFDSYIFKYDNGAYDVDDIGLGNEDAVKANEYIMNMVDEGFISADITFDLARGAFENGETAFYIGGPWDVGGFESTGLSFAVAPMPTLNGNPFATPVGTQVGFVSAKSEKQEATWDFFKFLMSEAAVELYEVGSRIPASLSAQELINIDDNTRGFMEQIANGEPLPTVPELGQLWTPYTDNMRLMFQGTITPKEAAQYVEQQLLEAIELMHEGA